LDAQRLKGTADVIDGLFSPMHLVIVLAIALIVLGPKRLPEAGRGLGEAIRGFKDSLAGGRHEDAPPAIESPRDPQP
jgi:sec-independent protein translocase protein TatA